MSITSRIVTVALTAGMPDEVFPADYAGEDKTLQEHIHPCLIYRSSTSLHTTVVTGMIEGVVDAEKKKDKTEE